MAQIAPFAFEADEKVCKLYVEQLQDVVNGGDYMPMETTFSEEDDPNIFDHVYSSLIPYQHYLDFFDDGPKPQVYWIWVTSTCRYWRDLICGTPKLWCDIHVYRRPDWLKLCLPRAATQPSAGLVKLHFHCPDFPLFELNILFHRQYATSLQTITFGAHPVWTTFFRKLLSTTLPNLTTLDAYPHLTSFSAFLDINTTPDLALSADNAPRLDVLRLSLLGPPTSVDLFSRLRILELSEASWRIPFNTLLDILAACSSLERLRLDRVLADVTDIPRPGEGLRRPVITLPRLHTLVVTSPHTFRTYTQVLSHLGLPAVTVLRIASIFEGVVENGLSLLPETFSALLPPSSASRIRSLATIDTVEYIAYRDIYSLFGRTRFSSRNILQLSFDRSEANEHIPRDEPGWQGATKTGLRDLVRLVPANNLSNIQLHVDFTALDRGDLEVAIRTFPRLASLSLTGTGDVGRVWKILTPTDEEAEMLCPGLAAVTISDGVDGDGFYASEEFFDVLLRSLEARMARGARLRLLQLCLHHWTEDEYDTLQGKYLARLKKLVVGRVEYEHVESSDEDSGDGESNERMGESDDEDDEEDEDEVDEDD
ncbi:hypothetical protein BD310DRAFT_1041896 [Dichomitus squalens]|uniref:F-box domain-containing protein n=1 Tax=Dichomitus squalens TaxID=114155 RepID=A0A4V2K706_9APHY|nr:hypothetical protein BD310DRAFT_1041896 [Dichomitus squalens]